MAAKPFAGSEEELAVGVSGAVDWDHYVKKTLCRCTPTPTPPGATPTPTAVSTSVLSKNEGLEQDLVVYKWTASGGTFRVTDAQGTVSWQSEGNEAVSTWKAPAVPVGELREYTLTCTIDDKPTSVTAPDTGERDDASIARSFKVKVDNRPSSASLRLYQDANGDTGQEKNPLIGGKAWIVMQLKVGSNSRLDPTMSSATVRVEEPYEAHTFEERHFDVGFDFDTLWESSSHPTGPWTPGASPKTANTGTEPMYYRAKVAWDTTTQPLGHNGTHTLKVVSVNGDANKHEISFQFRTNQTWGDTKEAGPNGLGPDVQNLVIEDVLPSMGNSDYFKFDPYSDNDGLRTPSFSFKINDTGDAHNYYWIVYIRPTSELKWNNQGNYYQGISISGFKEGAGSVQTEWDGLDTTGEIAHAGTYSFDIYAWETDQLSFNPSQDVSLDQEGYKAQNYSYHTYFPEINTNGSEGHDVQDRREETGNTANASYQITDTFQKSAQYAYVDVLDDDLELKKHHSLPTITNQHIQNQKIYDYAEDEPYGLWRYVFSGEDSHKAKHRNHRNKRILSVNSKSPTPGKMKQVILAGELAATEYYMRQGWQVLLSPTRKATNRGGFDFVVYRFNVAKQRYDVILGDNKAWSAETHATIVVGESSDALSALFRNYAKNKDEAADVARQLTDQHLGQALLNALNNPEDAGQLRRVVTDVGGSTKTSINFTQQVLAIDDFQYKKIAAEVNNQSDIWRVAWKKAEAALNPINLAVKEVLTSSPELSKVVKNKVTPTVVAKAAGKVASKGLSVLLIGLYIREAKLYQQRTQCTNAAAADYALSLAVADTFFVDEYLAFVAWESERYDRFVKNLRADVRGFGNFKITDDLINGLDDPNWPNEDL